MDNITLLLAIHAVSEDPEDGHFEFQEDVEQMIAELCGLSGKLSFDVGELGNLKPDIEHIPYPSSEIIDIFLTAYPEDLKWMSNYDEAQREFVSWRNFIKISVDVPFDRSIQDDIKIKRQFSRRIHEIVVASNLASLGSFDFEYPVFVSQDILPMSVGVIASSFSLRNASLIAAKFGWPKLKRLDFEKTWNWVSAHKGYVDGFSCNSTERALMAFSYQISFLPTPLSLFWALVGIEALFVRGNQSLLRQVIDKSQVLFGKPEVYKDRLKKMYNYRSRLIHGDLDFPGRNYHWETPKHSKSMKFDRELTENSSFGIAILAAALQELVDRNWMGFDFNYTYDVKEDLIK